jgi:kumamolisin
MLLRRILVSIAAGLLACAGQALADPMNLLDGAQSIPAHHGGRIIIPASSLAMPEDFGVRAHSNARFFLLAMTATKAAAASGPPFPGYNFETPASLACIYGLAAQATGCNPNTVTAVAQGGSRAIAIVDAYHYPNAMADLKYFSAQFGLPAPTSSSFQLVYASGVQPQRNLGWELEEALDIQMAHAMAPNAKLYLVEAASNSLSALLTAVDKAAQLVASAGGGEVSMSWGSSEFSSETSYDSHFQKSGVVFFASAGDSPGVAWPSASANVVAVGGTSISRELNTYSFLHHASWSDGGAGTSSYVALPSYQFNYQPPIGGANRAVPDIAAVADPTTGVWVYDSGNGGWFIVGGTSVSSPLVAGIVNSSGHFYTSSAAELAQIYNTSASNPAAFAAAATGYCGPQAAYAVTTGWNFCLGVGSPQGLSSQ